MPAIAAMVAAIGDNLFPARLTELLRAVVPYRYTVIFAYAGDAQPIDLYDDFPTGKRQIFVADYQAGPYLLDPFFLAATRPVPSGLYRIRDLAPDRFYQGEYFRNYYVQTGLAEEVGYFVNLPGGVTVVASLMRDDLPFTMHAFRRLQQVSPVVAACIARHWAELAQKFVGAGQATAQGRRVEQAFHSFGQGLLTPRERQIAEYTLKGHSPDAMGRILGIAPGTVRIHRRNIYAKLRIGSQGELFSRFILSLEGSD